MDEQNAELRLAVVCYGGVSLAVYMHGVTKELHKLICAARQFDTRRGKNPFPNGTEKVYFDALTDIAEHGPRLQVNIDIIGGTSAGGINGIALGKAIARNASLEPLKKVWIDDGDIRKLLRGTRIFGLVAQVASTVVRQLVRILGSSSPLRGEYMSKLLLEALTAMEDNRDSDADSLLSDADRGLELYVPTTDLSGFEVLVPSGIGGASNRDRDYRQVLTFSGTGTDLVQFGPDYTADLAFAGRATSSFPGAFAPVSQRTFREEVDKEVQLHPDTTFLCQYDKDRTDDVFFVDGGVLDNAPFDLVIDAIVRRRAQMRVYRELIYIEPDPGQELYSSTREKPVDTKRRYLKDLVAVSTVRGSHPILTDLTKLRDMNWRIAEVQAIAEQQESYVEKRTNAALQEMGSDKAEQGQPLPAEMLSTAQLVDNLTGADEGPTPDGLIQAVSDKVYAKARDSLGPAWSTYQRLKFEAVMNRLADEVNRCFGSARPSAKAGFVVATWIAWARQHDVWQGGHTRALGDLLRQTDMPYRERRLMFILGQINNLYDFVGDQGWRPPVEDLNALKSTVWDMITKIRDVTFGAVALIYGDHALDFLRLSDEGVVKVDPEDFARDDQNRQRLQEVFNRYADELKPACDDSHQLLDAFQKYTKNWGSETAKNSLLNRYLGFALWDGILFPTISLTELPQLTPIPVAQFSPIAAGALKPPIEERRRLRSPEEGEPTPAKLKGLPVHHFAAFFEAEFRENDYLWGRLDGAELILKMLTDVANKHATTPVKATDHLADALKAVLDTEKGLKRVEDLRAYLETQVEDLRQKSTAPTKVSTGPV